MQLIKDLWRGDISLVKTYWLFGVAPSVIFYLALTYVQHQGDILASGFGVLFVCGFVLFFFIIYSGFICIAIWRSANKYQGMKKYAILAKVAAIFGVMALIKAALEMFGIGPHS